MLYHSSRSKKRLFVTAIFISIVPMIALITSIVVSSSWAIPLFFFSLLLPLLLLSITVFKVAKDTYLTIDNGYLSWEGILTKTPKASIALEQITSIKFKQQKYSDSAEDSDVIIHLVSGDSFIVPIPDDSPTRFAASIRAACPQATYSEIYGKIEQPWSYVAARLFKFKKLKD